MKKVVLDTNCLLVAIPSKSPFHKIWKHFIEGKMILCVSNEILLEYEEIISQKTNQYFADLVINTILNKPNVIRVSPSWRFDVIQTDPDDNKFVDCAVCGGAEYIVSNDKHFNILKETYFPYTELYTIQEFCNLL
ncbi:MAG: putative toxin-antitoxin system toxin component, PIN family [Bacteroidales bacterium]|nr:putative toxin-antitoxin system toxin component, PIN family [Bacteroidales bacterium]